MALSLSVSTAYGIAAAYHRVVQSHVVYPEGAAYVAIASYIDQGSREAGKDPLQAITTRLAFSDMGDTTEPTRTQIYDALKALPAWAGATDC